MNKKKIIIVLIIIAVVVLGAMLIKLDKKDGTETVQASIPEFQDNTEIIREILNETEEDYQETIAISTIYDRSDFYNETRMNINSVDGYITFVNIEEIDIDEIYKVYNVDGKEIEELENPNYNGMEVEVSSSSEFTVGNYYIIKYQPYDEMYSYYYVTELTDNGFENLELFLITEGESVGNEMLIDDVEMK